MQKKYVTIFVKIKMTFVSIFLGGEKGLGSFWVFSDKI